MLTHACPLNTVFRVSTIRWVPQEFEVPVVDWLMNASGGLLLLVGALIFIAASSDEVIYC